MIPRSDVVGMRLGRFLDSNGSRDLLEFLRRRAPESRQEFISQLYLDIRQILNTIQKQAHHLLKREEWLRDQVRNNLGSRGYNVASEEDHRGHTDLLVRNSDIDVTWIGEAKVHSDYDYLKSGMEQLHTRYSVGVEGECGLVIFLFSKNAKLMVERWKEAITTSGICGYVPPFVDDKQPFDFTSKHNHHSGAVLETRHFICYVYYEPQEPSANSVTSTATAPPN